MPLLSLVIVTYTQGSQNHAVPRKNLYRIEGGNPHVPVALDHVPRTGKHTISIHMHLLPRPQPSPYGVKIREHMLESTKMNALLPKCSSKTQRNVQRRFVSSSKISTIDEGDIEGGKRAQPPQDGRGSRSNVHHAHEPPPPPRPSCP